MGREARPREHAVPLDPVLGIKVRWCSIGENVGYGPSVAAIEDAYMASAGHRANILNTKWNGVGVGYAKNGNRIFTVQVFIKTC